MANSAVNDYLATTKPTDINGGFLAYLANLTEVAKVAPSIARDIVFELRDQRSNLKLIASENYSSLPTQLAMGNLLTDKYAEGFPYHRFYAGCDNVDSVESYTSKQACKLFGVDHAYVQPHSGADANLVAFWAILNARVKTPELERLGVKDPTHMNQEDWNKLRSLLGNQRLLGMDYYAGGHLTHGYRHNVSAQMFEAFGYGVNQETGFLDYDEIQKMAVELKPLILLAGYSAYPRAINFKRLREIADQVGAVLMVDMAHFAGLVAGGVFTGEFNPVLHAQVVTTTTHKTLRGPRGGLILCTKEFADHVDKGCPLVMGGPLPHVMAAKAVALTEANTQEFKDYAHRVADNAKSLAQACMEQGMSVLTNGTENHLLLIDVRPFGLTGRQAESAVRECGITLNRNSLPNDTNGAWYTSGLRLGTPAITSLGMGSAEKKEIAICLKKVLSNTQPQRIEAGPNAGKTSKARYVIAKEAKDEVSSHVKSLLERFPVYPELDLDFLLKYFA
ncbi:MAG TPA: glycine hydroxymethyltransferase [Firmicutes bacterium]|nr:glycine hydroxymethyltransferase [Bacillota bacterium]